jgi:hypothetical protein
MIPMRYHFRTLLIVLALGPPVVIFVAFTIGTTIVILLHNRPQELDDSDNRLGTRHALQRPLPTP